MSPGVTGFFAYVRGMRARTRVPGRAQRPGTSKKTPRDTGDPGDTDVFCCEISRLTCHQVATPLVTGQMRRDE
jgi:hypothetical protein